MAHSDVSRFVKGLITAVLVCLVGSSCTSTGAMDEPIALDEGSTATGTEVMASTEMMSGSSAPKPLPAAPAPQPLENGHDVGFDSFEGLTHDAKGVVANGQAKGVLVTPSGWVTPILKATADSWTVWTPCGRAEQVTQGRVIEKADFVIDPGHGGPSEPGAVGPSGLREADLNMEVSTRIRDYLRSAGYSVVMTRHSDVRVPIVTRAEIARALDPIAFISVHFNAGTNARSARPGTEMYHQLDSADSKRLAGLLYEETVGVLSLHSIDWVALVDAGVLVRADQQGDDYYGVLRRPGPVTSVLAEFGYLSNSAEEKFYSRPEVQEMLAEATVRAVNRYVRSSDPGSGFVDKPMFRGFGPSGAGRTDNCVDPVLQ